MHQFLCLLRRNCTPAALDNHSWMITHPTVRALVEAQFLKRSAPLRHTGKIQITSNYESEELMVYVQESWPQRHLTWRFLHFTIYFHTSPKYEIVFSKCVTWKKFQHKLFQFNKVTNSWKQDLTMGLTTGVQPALLPTGAHHCSVLGSGLLSLFFHTNNSTWFPGKLLFRRKTSKWINVSKPQYL